MSYTKRIYVDPDFYKELKKDATDNDMTMTEYTKKLAKERKRYEFPY
jgi:hypothetical protein